MTPRRVGRITAIGAVLLAGCLALSVWLAVRVRDAQAARSVSSVLIEPRQALAKAGPARPGRSMVSVPAPLAACEARIERRPRLLPTVAVVGASITAGTGPNNPEESWAVELARQLHWNAVVYGVPGTGYLRASGFGRGPMTRMLGALNLPALDPALVIVQAGHDDLGASAALEERRVRATVDLIHAAAPGARIGLLTTFAGVLGGTPALRGIDRAIISAGTAADPGVVIMDPLAGQWSFPRAADGLHPTAAGDAWIARRVAAILRAHGVRPAPATAGLPVICDVSIGAGKPVSATD
ncbi:MAG TPA: SGNH/GDSL hydrolase family protein [Trebonia sp.]|nr:SGNH/GDSL hydrolase family protein [Trebonia sp.]